MIAKKNTVPTMSVAIPRGLLINTTLLELGVTDRLTDVAVVDITIVLSIAVDVYIEDVGVGCIIMTVTLLLTTYNPSVIIIWNTLPLSNVDISPVDASLAGLEFDTRLMLMAPSSDAVATSELSASENMKLSELTGSSCTMGRIESMFSGSVPIGTPAM